MNKHFLVFINVHTLKKKIDPKEILVTSTNKKKKFNLHLVLKIIISIQNNIFLN